MTYHGVIPKGYESEDPAFDGNLISAEMLRQQLRLLKAHYDVIAPADVLAWREGRARLPSKAVLLTCDDGLLNCLTDMLPVLRQEGLSCLFFVTSASARESRTMLWYEELFLMFLHATHGPFEISAEGIVVAGDLGEREGRRAAWWNLVKRLSQIDAQQRESFLGAARKQFGLPPRQDFDDRNLASCRRFGLLTCAELRELLSAGMTIGAHTLSHPMLSQLSPELAYAEISESRMRLETALQEPVWAFAYPFGDPPSVTPQVLEMPQKAGYKAAFMNFGGGLGAELPPFALPRVHVTAGMSRGEFEAHLSGFYLRLQQRAGRGSQNVGMKQA
jgi:peptidoglycan/xylan/chitin deacetylase (PgdA/CDA1 family)